jgi:hypothetical protein
MRPQSERETSYPLQMSEISLRGDNHVRAGLAWPSIKRTAKGA